MILTGAAAALNPVLSAFLQQALAYGVKVTIGNGERVFEGLDQKKKIGRLIIKGEVVLTKIEGYLTELDDADVSYAVIDHVFSELHICFEELEELTNKLKNLRS